MLADLLEDYGSSAAVIQNDGMMSGRELVLRVQLLSQELTRLKLCSVLAITDSPADVVVAISACQLTGTKLTLGPSSLGELQISEIAAECRIEGVLRTSQQGELAAAPTGVSAENHQGFEVALMTSGTSGKRKIASHSLSSLMGRIRKTRDAAWLLTYTPTAFAGIQVILTALASCSRLVSTTSHSMSEIIPLATRNAVTHASGTPTFWRTWLLGSSDMPVLPKFQQITLGGEAVDQITLDRLSAAYPDARITHIYASTEAGVVFSVHDRKEGFPAEWLSTGVDGIGLRVRDDVLEIRTPLKMNRYLSGHSEPMTQDGWLRTGDRVCIEEDRVLFTGRADTMINVAGYKVFPEEVERALLQIKGIADACVYPKPNAITGNVLVADIACDPGASGDAVLATARAHLSNNLPRHLRPAVIRAVPSVQTADTGKKQRVWR